MPIVLIADDSSSLRSVVRIALRSQGWSVLEASSPSEAIAVAQREHPDAVLLDIVFEGEVKDGYSVCRALKAEPSTAQIPVVMLTVRGGSAERFLAERVGAVAYITKPFGPLELIETLRKVLAVPTAQPGLGLYLLAAGRLGADQLQSALDEQKKLAAEGKREPLGELLARQGVVDRGDVERALAEQRAAAARPRDATPRTIRIVIADDHDAFREGLRAVLTVDAGFELVGTAADGHEAVRVIAEQLPDVAVIDYALPGMGGLDVVRAIVRRGLPTPVILFSAYASVREAAMQSGAAVFLLKDVDPRVLVAEVKRLASKEAVAEAEDGGLRVAFAEVSQIAWSTVAARRRGLAILGAIAVAYAGAFLIAEPVLGASAAVLAVVAVALAGALLGPEAGVIDAIISAATNIVLWGVTGHHPGEPVITVGGNGSGFLALLLIGVGFGTMHWFGGRFDRRARRVAAVTEAVLGLAASDGSGLQVAVDAARALVPADVVLLFVPVAGAAVLEVVAVSGGAGSVIGQRQAIATGAIGRVYEEGEVRVANDLSAGLALVFAPNMRSALFAPVAIGGLPPAGVLVALSSHMKGFSAADGMALRQCAAVVLLALQSPSRSSATNIEAAAVGSARP